MLGRLQVVAVELSIGTGCMTVCAACKQRGASHPVPLQKAIELVAAHEAGHP